MSVQANLKKVQAVINEACNNSNRKPEEVTVIAVTKYVSIPRAIEVIDAGVKHIGENRVEEGIKKWQAIGDDAKWHFIGNLQSRKVKNMIEQFDYIHSLDRLSLAKEIDKRAPTGNKLKCFVQVNVSGEKSKSGIRPEETVSFIEKLASYKSIEVVGLMTMAPFTEDEEEVRPYFRKLRELKENVADLKLPHAPCQHLSMGMSNDYKVAIEEGATFIRIGTALVG